MSSEEQATEPLIGNINRALPTAFDVALDSYYVRECYRVYYSLVIDLLHNSVYKYITLTGTPGIGKSIFYQYFFSRYRKEYPDIPIIAASFNKKQVQKCVVFVPYKAPIIIKKLDFLDIESDYPNAIHLYDGPPNMKPNDSKLVTFTSPNSSWFNFIRKNVGFHHPLYMPVWEFAELARAVDLLELDLTINELYRRFYEFGGEVRFCLQTNIDDYQEGEDSLQQAIKNINTVEALQSCFDLKVSMEHLIHRLLHYVPKTNPRFATLKIGSEGVENALYNKLGLKFLKEREKLMLWLEGAGKASTFYGWLFENLAHEILIEGGVFKCTILEESDAMNERDLYIVPAVRRYDRFKNDFTLEKIFYNAYHIPISQTFLSIGPFYYSNEVVTMFQITKSSNHPVNPAGLIDLFIKLRCLEVIRETPTLANLYQKEWEKTLSYKKL
ncbi:hypothetical protein THRCLA_22729 [Thraustotheca clavata]|uniref:Crinkler (CRN) family protein n=1 Tax=Thraustotheca clavata TaxID=74557 RepID=A0A1V9YTP1_9STRA|nr:hypothetical protein THRCLA_22729 [Thraustotheca clavata]